MPTKQIGSPAHILTAIHEPIIMMMTHMMMRAIMVMVMVMMDDQSGEECGGEI